MASRTRSLGHSGNLDDLGRQPVGAAAHSGCLSDASKSSSGKRQSRLIASRIVTHDERAEP
jgi:hypothetical protein